MPQGQQRLILRPRRRSPYRACASLSWLRLKRLQRRRCLQKPVRYAAPLSLHFSRENCTADYAESIALSISLASALTSFFISFLARLIASSTARSIVASPTTINAASLSSSMSPTSLRSELDIPPRRWPMSAPAPAPTNPLTRIDGGKITPIAAPTAKPAQPPCWVGFSVLSTILTLPSSFLVRTAAS